MLSVLMGSSCISRPFFFVFLSHFFVPGPGLYREGIRGCQEQRSAANCELHRLLAAYRPHVCAFLKLREDDGVPTINFSG